MIERIVTVSGSGNSRSKQLPRSDRPTLYQSIIEAAGRFHGRGKQDNMGGPMMGHLGIQH